MNEVRAKMDSQEQIGGLSLLELREMRAQSAKHRSRSRVPPLLPQERHGAVPLSYAQERLWFLDQLGLVGPAYNMPMALRLEGVLDVRALERSFAELIRRHESLRTRFASTPEGPVQIIDPPGEFTIEVRNLSNLADKHRDSEIQRLTSEEAKHTFDLEKGPVMRVSLLRLSDDVHVLLLTLHHIAADGWSLAVLNRELSALYAAYSRGFAPSLPELPVQYADYAIWQRQWLQGEVLQNQLSYWRERLQDAPPNLQLPADRPRPAVASFRGDYLSFNLASGLRASLEELARSQGATLFMAVLAAFQVLLSRYSGQQDIVVGSGIAGRTNAQTEGLIGFFVNTLVLRTDLSDNPSFRQLLARTKEMTLAAYARQDLPFEKLVKELRPERNLARQPIFQVAMALQNAPQDQLQFEGLTWTRLKVEHFTALFDLTLHLYETSEGLQGLLEYATDLFDRETIERMTSHFRVLLEGLVADPDERVQLLPVLEDTERTRLLRVFNATALSSDASQLVHERFEIAVRLRPGTVAVVCGTEQLTYAELAERANQLANFLVTRGVRPDERVALYTERGIEMIVGMLGILKAGAAYVPVDISYPVERLTQVLRDSAPVAVLTQNRLKGRVPLTKAVLVSLDDDAEEIGQHAKVNPGPARLGLDPGHLAYVVYTSGSTGVPKGVMVEHHNLANLVDWHCTQFKLTAGCRCSCVAAVGFDAVAWEVWPALSIGATLVVATPAVAADVEALVSWWGNEPLDVGFLPTPIAELALQRNVHRAGLRALLVGGDRLRIRSGSEAFELYNNYGPTEATVVATSGRIFESDTILHIGRPIANAQVYILDSHGLPVPLGAAGEIHIGGAGVARGYLNQPELTRERFVTDPFSSRKGARMYRSGDLGRWRPDGTIEYLGRNDEQVKVRGYRIELGEIEAQLLKHEHVAEAVVIAREDEHGEKRLVAYVAANLQRLKAAHRESSVDSPESVDQWKALYEETYAAGSHAPSFIGWNSSYTGRPIPHEQMQEWLQTTVARIRGFGPRRILEIGCGVGLLLEQLAPECEVYRGVDFSGEAISKLNSWLGTRPELRHVRLERGAALDVTAPAREYDTIIINSVVQYFPDVDYLWAVLDRAVGWLSPGGRIFVGDVRHLGLLKVFHSSIQLERAGSGVSVRQLRGRVARAIEQEKELVIDPGFFMDLPKSIAGIAEIQVLLRRGHSDNELTRYRYDAVVTVGAPQEARRLRKLHGVANCRLSRDLRATHLIDTSEGTTTSEQLRDVLDRSPIEGEDPEAFWTGESEDKCEIRVSWSSGSEEGSFDVEYVERQVASRAVPTQPIAEVSSIKLVGALGDREQYANDPWGSTLRRRLVPRLRDHLKDRLPAYMVPSAFVILKELPLTLNGKVDRRALPAPRLEAYSSREYEAPQGEIEEVLAGIWQELLRVERVGRQDNFFELGGHSLLIVQMMERLRRAGFHAEVRGVFENPTLASLAGTLSGEGAKEFGVPANLIPPECDEITPRMLPLVDLDADQIQRIVRTVSGGAGNIQDIYPLAPLQEGILFHHLLSEHGDVYVVPMLLSLVSRQRLDELIAALQGVVDRHDVLRTAVLWEQLPRPVQVVYRRVSLPVEPIVLDSGRDPLEQLEERMKPERQRLDLRRAPPLRLEVAADPNGVRWYALLRIHHLVCDGQSIATLIAEVVAHLGKREQELPEPVPYRNHVAHALAYDRTHNAEAFFRRKLGDLEEPTAPFELLDVHGDGSRIDQAHEALDSALSQRLRAQARRSGVSAATLFHAAWGLVVARTSARDDVVYGSVLLGRLQGTAGGQRVLGMFINTLPLRLKLKDINARQLIDQTQRELVELLDHEQASLAVAQRCSAVPGSTPLFSTLLNYRHSAADFESDFTGATGVTLIGLRSLTNYPITMSVDDQGDLFVLEVETDRRVDPIRIVDYMRTALNSLLEALEHALLTPVLSLPVITEAEREKVLIRFNDTAVPYPQDRLIHELFEEQVRRTPDAIAVVSEEQSLTYAQLNVKANQLAALLLRRGVRIGDYIPILMSRSLELVIAQLAVLKSGAVYVPVDPKLPVERQVFMIRDCQARRILVGHLLSERFEASSVEWIDCTQLTRELEELPRDNVGLRIPVPPAAYVMYTSGSTGSPKGVVISHRGVNRLVINSTYARIEPEDCIAHSSNPAFDASTFEIWAALLNGGRLLIVPAPVVLDVDRFAETLKNNRVSVLWITIGLFAQYATALGNVIPQLRYLMTGGDIVDPAIVNRVLRSGAPGCLLSAYGPTECTTFSTIYRVEETCEGTASVSIGRPISNSRIYILDERLQPTPIGVPGEIYIGGDGVALGYLDRPDLTSERFVSDPFSQLPNSRLYKSGDLGLWRADGNVEFRGRNDKQVKLRGFRIELGEIESHLLQHSGVKEAIVSAREDIQGDKRLVAYLTRAEGEALDIEELRSRLKAVLPEYMVPSTFVIMDRMPLTANGKPDRGALPPPDAIEQTSGGYVAPGSGIEEQLAVIWQKLLGTARVDRRDNFFERGGHSLHVMRLNVMVAEEFSTKLSVSAVFQNPTLEAMAGVIQNLREISECEEGEI